jgi:ubiquitin-conjugating enzyme E2 Q
MKFLIIYLYFNRKMSDSEFEEFPDYNSDEDNFEDDLLFEDDFDLTLDQVQDHLADTNINVNEDPAFQGLVQQFSGQGSAAGTKRLCEDLHTFHKNSKDIGYSVELVDDNLYHWQIRLTDFPDDCNLYKELKKHPRHKVVHLEVLFPQQYPFEPPFIRVLQPRFKYLTGHITIGGSICMQVLTKSGWVPSYSLENLLMQIKAEMVEGNARLDLTNLRPYSEYEAREAFKRVSARYGWNKT